VGGQRLAPAALPPGKTRCLLYRRLGGSQGRFGQVRKISPPPGFDPRTVQPVTSHYADWAIPDPVIPIVKIQHDVLFMYMHNNHRHRVTAHLQLNIQDVPLATEPGISSIILTPTKILQRNLNMGMLATCHISYTMK
jgi:hypothetical protein